MDEPPNCESSWRDHWTLPPILVIATLFRLWQVNESLWLDELHSAWVVSAGLSEIVERAQIGNQSPLYFYLPWATTSLFGMSEWALRLPSLLAGVGLVTCVYGFMVQLTKSRIAASACAVLAALDHNLLFYATETRPYACVQLVAIVQLFLFWKLQVAPSVRRRIGFIISSVVLFYLHYTAILLLAGEIVFVLIRVCYSRKRQEAAVELLSKLAIDLIWIAAFTVPMITHVLDIGSRRSDWGSFIRDTSLVSPVGWLSLVSYVAVPTTACLVIGVVKVASTLWRSEPFASDLISTTTRDCVSTAGSTSLSRRNMMATLLACWLCVPLALVWILTVTDVVRLYFPRYIIGAALAPVLYVGLCVDAWKSKRLQLLVAGLTIAFAFWTSGMIGQFRCDGRLFQDRRENWREAVHYVNQHRRPNGPIFVRSGLLEADRLADDDSELLRDYCVSPVTSIYFIEHARGNLRPLTTRSPGELTEEDVTRIRETTEAWFIINGHLATVNRCRDRVLTSLSSRATTGVVRDRRQFGSVGVFLVAATVGGSSKDESH